MKLRKPSLRQIEAFKAFVETGSVSRAADALFISQPAASKLLNNLELDVGMQLIERSAGRPTVTDRGMRVYEEIDRILTGVDQIGQAIATIRDEDRSLLTIGVIPGFPPRLLAAAARRVKETRPDISLTFIVRSFESISHGLMSRKMDVGLIAREIDHPQIQTRLFFNSPLVAVMSPKHPLAEKSSLELVDLSDHPLILFTKGSITRGLIDTAVAEAGLSPEIAFEATTAANCCALASEGLGVCIISPLLARDHMAGLVSRPLKPDLILEVYIARLQTARDDRGIRLFLDVLEEMRDAPLTAL